MSVLRDQLLDAAIQHLQELKAQGVRFISVSPEMLAALAAPRPQPTAPAEAASNRPTTPPRPTRPVLQPDDAPPQSTVACSPAWPTASTQQSFEAQLSAPSDSAPLDRGSREAAMAGLQARAMVCRKCPHLASSRKNVVFGVGDPHSPLMFIGEAPGADEDERGEPFVGKAGQLLTRIIQTMGFTRQTVYIANILKCRPDTPGQMKGNRKPTADEMKTCMPYLLAQIDLIQPRTARPLAGVPRCPGHAHLPSGLPAAQRGAQRKAQDLGGHARSPRKARPADQRKTTELFFKGLIRLLRAFADFTHFSRRQQETDGRTRQRCHKSRPRTRSRRTNPPEPRPLAFISAYDTVISE